MLQPQQDATVYARAELYLPPFHERNPDGSLGVAYGPSLGSFAAAVARAKDWAWRRQASREARRDGALMRAFMRRPDGSLRPDVPAREQQVYVDVFEQGHNTRWVARHRGISRDTVKTYLKRLRGRLGFER